MSLNRTKIEILKALSHPESEDGLYFENLSTVHEDEERVAVSGSELEILEALRELMDEGKVIADESGEKVIFSVVTKNVH